jgi:hypothetical protein
MNFSFHLNDEVTRLRRLRQSALKVRALAMVLTDGHGADRLFERAALLHWRIARIATGRLRSHPYQNYQRDPSFFESGSDRLAANLVGTLANLRGRPTVTFLRELRLAARELDDTRALTLSAELSDALGRAQTSMRNLLDDAEQQALMEAGSEAEAPIDAAGAISARSLSASSYASSSYLAL